MFGVEPQKQQGHAQSHLLNATAILLGTGFHKVQWTKLHGEHITTKRVEQE